MNFVQTCSGMIAGSDSHIEANFQPQLHGNVATISMRFADFEKLGKLSNEKDAFGYQLKDYICTPQAVGQSCATMRSG